jgi:hypothetical protein
VSFAKAFSSPATSAFAFVSQLGCVHPSCHGRGVHPRRSRQLPAPDTASPSRHDHRLLNCYRSSLLGASSSWYKKGYSYRNAVIGSTFVARRAGTQQAAKATKVSNTAITLSVQGSVALTPYNCSPN